MIYYLKVALSPTLHGVNALLNWHGMRMLLLSAMTLAAATVSWFLFERPCLSLKRLFPYSRLQQTPRCSIKATES